MVSIEIDPLAILQRTDAGRETIKTKSIKLTQSERLLLIVVDGITPVGKLRQKVWALTEERFTRGLKNLFKKDLVYEVLFPLMDQQAEELDSDVVSRFLKQDPLDPITLILFDPEDELGTKLIEEMGYAAPQAVKKESPPQAHPIAAVTAPPTLNPLAPASARTDRSESESIAKPISEVDLDFPLPPRVEVTQKTQIHTEVSLAPVPVICAKEIIKREPITKLGGNGGQNRAHYISEWCSWFIFASGIVILLMILAPLLS